MVTTTPPTWRATGRGDPIGERLEELGFARTARHDEFRRDDCTATIESRWLRLTVPAPQTPPCDPLRGQLGRPGPWRLVPGPRGLQRCCELPLALLDAQGTAAEHELLDDPTAAFTADPIDVSSSEVAGVLAASLEWLLAIADEHLPRGWCPPPREEIDEWIAPGKLLVRSGAHTSQGALIHDATRLAITFPILNRIPAELPAPRAQWLDRILVDALRRWRLVRVGFTAVDTTVADATVDAVVDTAVDATATADASVGAIPAGVAGEVTIEAASTTVGGAAHGSRALAEVDLSGAPHWMIRSLFPVALDALRWVVGWTLHPAALTVDRHIASRILERGPGVAGHPCPRPR
jgi:hypothetical protein